MVLSKASLSRTVDAVNEAAFEKRRIPEAERKATAHWIAGRQGLPGAYSGTFAGFDAERREGIVVFTGERMTSASARHILGEEACRALLLLRVSDRSVHQALGRATEGLHQALERAALDPRNTNPGIFCCGKCSVGLWRHLLAGGLDRREERLRRGVERLRSMRDGQGRWRVFPFWYTVSALVETDLRPASAELRYAAAVLERAARREPGPGLHQGRRRRLAQLALERI